MLACKITHTSNFAALVQQFIALALLSIQTERPLCDTLSAVSDVQYLFHCALLLFCNATPVQIWTLFAVRQHSKYFIAASALVDLLQSRTTYQGAVVLHTNNMRFATSDEPEGMCVTVPVIEWCKHGAV
jgi:hypothetical protein